MYNANFTEVHDLLDVINPASYNAEQNTAWVDMRLYERVVIVINAGDIGTSLDCDIEIATDSSGSNIHTLTNMTQLTEAGGDDNANVAIEVRAEELTNPSGAGSSNYRYLRAEVTPVGATIFSVEVYGWRPRYAPVSTSNWDEIVSN